MWASLRNGAAVLLVVALAGACAKTTTSSGSGETHFVMCDDDGDCAAVSNTPNCGDGYCRDDQGNRIEALDGAAGGGNKDTGNPPDSGLACPGGCGDAECAAPGTCSLAQACTTIMCDYYSVDANACVRPACEHDADCPEDERCISTQWARRSNCMPDTAGNCLCDGGLSLNTIHVCSPTSQAGVRGEWQHLVVGEDNGLTDVTIRTYAPDGTVTVDAPDARGGRSTSTKQLTPEDFELVELSANGPFLRRALLDSTTCEVTEAPFVNIALELDTTSLQQEVAGCVLTGRPLALFRELYDLGSRY